MFSDGSGRNQGMELRRTADLIEGAPPVSVHRRVNKRRGTVWVVRYRDPLPRERTFDRKADAERFERYVRHQLDTDQYLDGESARLTFADWAERWWPTVENSERAPSTISGYESALRIQVLPYLGERRLRTLHRIDMEEWLGELRVVGYSNSIIHAARTVAGVGDAVRPAAYCRKPDGAARRARVGSRRSAGSRPGHLPSHIRAPVSGGPARGRRRDGPRSRGDDPCARKRPLATDRAHRSSPLTRGENAGTNRRAGKRVERLTR